jgi:hypothetical protein
MPFLFMLTVGQVAAHSFQELQSVLCHVMSPGLVTLVLRGMQCIASLFCIVLGSCCMLRVR